jgi:hypothetical protein
VVRKPGGLSARKFDSRPIVINHRIQGQSIGLGGLFSLIVGAPGVLFSSRGSLLTALLAIGVVAVMFQPIRDSLRQAVSRLMYRERCDPVGVFYRLASQLGMAEAMDTLSPSMVEDIADALKLPHISAWLPEKGVDQSHLTPTPRCAR